MDQYLICISRGYFSFKAQDLFVISLFYNKMFINYLLKNRRNTGSLKDRVKIAALCP